MNAIRNLLLLCISLVVSLLAGEGLVRLLGAPRGAEPSLGANHGYDSLLGWRNTPNSSALMVTAEYRVLETFNSRGMRGPERAVPKPPGVRRVLLLGDSYTEGYTVADDSTVGSVLERLLNEGGGARVEVIAAGTAGYSTDQELLWYASELRALDPDVVVLMFFVNDIWYNNRDRYWRGSKPRFVQRDTALVLTNVPVPPPQPTTYPFRVEGGSGVVALVRRMDSWFGRHSALYVQARRVMKNTPALSGLLMRMGLASVPGEIRPWRRHPDQALATSWTVTERLVDRLRDAVEADGARFVLFDVPERENVYDRAAVRAAETYGMDSDQWSPGRDEQVVGRICERLAIECVMPAAAFEAERMRLGGADAPARLYFRADDHWTPAGHAFAARVLAEAIRAESPTARTAPSPRR